MSTQRSRRTSKAKTPRLRDTNFFLGLEKALSESAPQSLLGITDDQLASMSRSAWAFLELHETPDAVRSFTLLCQINPYVPDFWCGLGRALRECGHGEDALSMLLIAETLDPGRGDVYLEEVACCLEIGKEREAKQIVHRMRSHRKVIAEFDEYYKRTKEGLA